MKTDDDINHGAQVARAYLHFEARLCKGKMQRRPKSGAPKSTKALQADAGAGQR
jgi:hypothetical protein